MKSSHKENTDLYFIILQLSLDKLFKCDCVGRKKKHDFGSFQKCKFDLTSQSKKTTDIWNFNMKQTLFYSIFFAVSCVKKLLAALQKCVAETPKRAA